MALLDFLTGPNKADGDASGNLYSRLRGAAGAAISRVQRTYFSPTTQEGLLVAGNNDQFLTFIRVDRNGNIITGNYIPELLEQFEGATVNVQKWSQTQTTFVQAQTTLAGFNYNNTALTTINAVSILQSQRLFYKFVRAPLQFKKRIRHSIVSGAIADWGFGVPSGTTLIVSTGVCFRLTNSGTIQGVITYNGVEINIGSIISQVASNGNTIGGNLNMSNSYYTSNYFVYDILIDDDNAIFIIQDTGTGEMIGYLDLSLVNTYQKMWSATSLPVYTRLYNNTAPSTAPVLLETECIVLSTDININMDASQIAGNLGMTAGRNPYTGAQLENHTNSTAPTSATLSNTAAGYATLGGRFQFAAVVGAVTDYALFGFQVPAGARFICEGIHIELYNTVVAVATTPTIFEWSMGFNSSAVSLATANIIRRQVGCQNFQVGAGVGACAAPLDVNFVTPEVVESGRFVHVILNIPVGTATATEIFRGTVLIRGRFI
jgi:hypothetical protein